MQSMQTSQIPRFSSGAGAIWLDDLQCTASDTKLITCTHRAVGTHSCGHSEDIAVFCTGKILISLYVFVLSPTIYSQLELMI